MKKIPIINFSFELGEIILRERYWDKSLFRDRGPVYAKVVDKKTTPVDSNFDSYLYYTFHVVSIDGKYEDYWHDVGYMIEHIQEKSKIFKLELTEIERAKILLMGL